MAEEIITDEMKKAIGVPSKPVTIEIEKGMIRKFAESIEDPNLLWQDEGYAKKSRYGGIIAPPGLLMGAEMRGRGMEMAFQLPGAQILDGGGDWEYIKPIKPGDVLTVVDKLHDLREREGRMGKMLFIVTETTWTNQHGELVARALGTLINY